MAPPSFQQWESDPLFSAAEVIQDSADRMDSIFRLLLHELSLVKGEHSDQKLLSSLEFHRRDLATLIETTKWQLEDFRRAVGFSATKKEDVNARHRQFIQAIREQVIHVEKSLQESSPGNPVRKNEWVDLNEEDRYGLAVFLSGGKSSEQLGFDRPGNDGMLRRFLDPGPETSEKDGVFLNSERRSLEIEATNNDTFVEEESRSRDVEANEENPKNFFHENKFRRLQQSKLTGFFGRPWTILGNRVARNYTKRLKDGEVRRDSPSATDASNDLRNLFGICGMRYQSSSNRIQFNQHSVQFIFLTIFALLVVGILMLKFA